MQWLPSESHSDERSVLPKTHFLRCLWTQASVPSTGLAALRVPLSLHDSSFARTEAAHILRTPRCIRAFTEGCSLVRLLTRIPHPHGTASAFYREVQSGLNTLRKLPKLEVAGSRPVVRFTFALVLGQSLWQMPRCEG
jgi:hypothetical protein